MSGEILLIGPLANQALADLFGSGGTAVSLNGRLSGGAHGGLDPHDWPDYRTTLDLMPAIRIVRSEALEHYLSVMQAPALQLEEGLAYGARQGSDRSNVEPAFESRHPELIAALAKAVISARPQMSPSELTRRLPAMAAWAQSQLRAASRPPSGGDIIAQRQQRDVVWQGQRQKYAGFFGLDIVDLAHRRHDGKMTPAMSREAFIMADAVVILPWDPVRDVVLVIEQFRIAPAVRRDPQPWLLEAVAGRIDAGETPEQAARREATEEAGLTLGALVPAVHYYPTPGAVTEFLYSYVAITDLPDGIAGIYGLESEHEDIRSHVIARSTLMEIIFENQITNGPLVSIALWLALRAEALKIEAISHRNH